jgi:hypothetical protein
MCFITLNAPYAPSNVDPSFGRAAPGRYHGFAAAPHPVKWRKSAVMSQRWRLNNGRELYHAEADGERRHDVSADHPEVVSRFRAEYDKWWDLVSRQVDDEVPISIGAPDEPETCLRSHDWWAMLTWPGQPLPTAPDFR